VPAKLTLVLTNEAAKHLINHENLLIFHGEDEFDRLVLQVKTLLLGKITFQKLVLGLNPDAATEMVVLLMEKLLRKVTALGIKN
jgi:hypothetical protein